MKKIWVLTFFLCSISILIRAQSVNLSQRISVNFYDATIEEALIHLSQVCQVKFAYSTDKIPLEALISYEAVNIPLAEVLDGIFISTQIVYARIGNQIVLKIDKKKEEIGGRDKNVRLSSREINYEHDTKVYRAEEMKSDSPLQEQPKVAKAMPTKLPAKALTEKDYSFDIDYSKMDFKGYINLKNYDIPVIDAVYGIGGYIENGVHRIASVGDSIHAHVGVFPSLDTRFGKSDEKDYFSASLLWGKSQNVEGMQISGLLNIVEEDLDGAQISSIGNVVEGNVEGLQMALVFNRSYGDHFGTQIATVSNIAYRMIGAQFSTVTNHAYGGFTGLQMTTVCNVAHNASSGTQISGLYNRATGKVQTQIGVINHAERVGFQLGFINMADTVSGAPIALLNLVKRGYNRTELSYNDALPFNLDIKLGAHGFYNIFKGSANEDFSTWGLGYGFGTYLRTSKRTGFNLEMTAMQINEGKKWASDWNLWGQFTLAFEMQLGRTFSLFLGPEFNIHYTQYFDTDNQSFYTTIAPYTIYEETAEALSSNPYRNQMWIGWSAGLRF